MFENIRIKKIKIKREHKSNDDQNVESVYKKIRKDEKQI